MMGSRNSVVSSTQHPIMIVRGSHAFSRVLETYAVEQERGREQPRVTVSTSTSHESVSFCPHQISYKNKYDMCATI